MSLPVEPPYPPMEALPVAEIPSGGQWLYEPKWDGFRCLAFREDDRVELQSKAGQPLARYFPELVAALLALKPRRFALDGEIAIPIGKRLSFDDLLQRIHPAESRVRRLSREFPAILIVFDLLVDEKGRSLVGEKLALRRRRLEELARRYFGRAETIRLSPATLDRAVAQKWLRGSGGALDGVIAKRADLAYRSGDRTGMQKIKRLRTADCVVGGFRYGARAKVVGSLLLGLYDEEGLLDHVGFCSGLTAAQRQELTPKLEKLVQPPGFTGLAPGSLSRWSTERSGEWEPLAPELVVEVQYDHFTGGRFRHGTRFLRWRPDKPPKRCTIDQVGMRSHAAPLSLLR